MALSDMYSLSEAGMNDPLQFRSTHYVPIGSIGGAPQWGNQYSWDINGLGLGGDGDRFSITAPGGEGFHLIDRGDGTNTLFSLVNGKLQQGKTEKYDNTMHGWGGFVEDIAPYAAALMAGYAGAGIAGLGTGAGAGAAGAGGEAAGTGLVAGTGTTGLQAGLGSGLTLAAPTGTGAGFAAGTGAGTFGAGIGASIPALPLAGQGGTGASYGLGGGDLGGGTGSGLSTGGSGSSLVPKTPQSTSSYSLGGSGASLTPASSGSGSGFQSFMDSVFNTNQGLTGFMNSPGYRIGSGLMQLFNAQDNNDMYRKLREMYGPNSAYAQQLRKQLERKDAASGRRSQYGPREVELQARLADMYSRNYPNMAAAQNARNMGYGQGLGLIMSGLGKTGALDSAWKGLTGLFGG